MKRFLVNFILYVIATALFVPFTLINVIVVFVKRQKSLLETLSGYFYSTALGIDLYANAEFRTLWNTMLRKRDGYEFGTWGETISYVLGRNKIDGTLTWTGEAVVLLLDLFDNDHVIKAVSKRDAKK